MLQRIGRSLGMSKPLARITPKRVKVIVHEDGTKEIIEEVPKTSLDSLSIPEKPKDDKTPPPRGRLIAKV